VYEAPLLRNITSRNSPLIIVSGKDVRTELALDRASYIDFALLLGTDFSQRIKNLGPYRALRFIREYKSIERVLQHEIKYPPRMPPEVYLEQVEAARSLFSTLPPLPDPDLLRPHQSDENEVKAILQHYGLHRATTDGWDFESALAGNYFEDNPIAG
jgi:flap endonuclease-1